MALTDNERDMLPQGVMWVMYHHEHFGRYR